MKTSKLISAVCFWLSSFGVYAQTEYFISAEGNDSNAGSVEAPFASLEKALEEARKASGEVTLFLREGTYRLQKTIVLTTADGNQSKTLNIRSYPGEKVVISGGQELDLDWKPYKKGIMQAPITDPVLMDMLLVNGEIRHMARYPKPDTYMPCTGATGATSITELPEKTIRTSSRWKADGKITASPGYIRTIVWSRTSSKNWMLPENGSLTQRRNGFITILCQERIWNRLS